MLYHNIRVLAHARKAVDPVVVAGASGAVFALGVDLSWWGAERYPATLVFIAALAVLFALVASRMNLYQARRTEKLLGELGALGEALLYASGPAVLTSELLTAGLPPIAYLGMFLGASGLLLTLRLASRIVVRQLRRRGKDERYWLLVGRNARSARFAQDILANPHFGVRIKRIVDLRSAEESAPPSRLEAFEREPLRRLPITLLENIEAIREMAAATVLDEVVVMLPLRTRYDEVRRILEICGQAGISVKLSPDHFEASFVKTELARLGNLPMVTHFTGPSNQVQLVAKRATDVICALVGLLALSPLLLAIAASVRMTSPGPILFRQTRLGLAGRRFRMLKFRTMVPNAPRLRRDLAALNQTDGVAFKIEHDPRITPVGKFLRRHHLDELPQLWNVLLGDMSLVGPRPLPPREASGREWWQRRRLSMPPGLTCLWQIKGDHRIPFRRWMEMDLEYIDRWSFWLDLRLIAATFGTLSRGTGW